MKWSYEKINLQENKKLSTIALILLLTASAIVAIMPATNAHTPSWNLQTYSFLNAAPNPAGTSLSIKRSRPSV